MREISTRRFYHRQRTLSWVIMCSHVQSYWRVFGRCANNPGILKVLES
jgi:hypothetical protein